MLSDRLTNQGAAQVTEEEVLLHYPFLLSALFGDIVGATHRPGHGQGVAQVTEVLLHTLHRPVTVGKGEKRRMSKDDAPS